MAMYGPGAGVGGAGPLNPAINQQRNNITNALMNISRPLPRTPLPQMPQSQPVMGITPTPAPGAPPMGAPTPQTTPPAIPTTLGVPPQQPGMGMAPQPGMGMRGMLANNPMTMATGQPPQR